MSVTQLLGNTLSPDAHLRKDAEDKLLQYSMENFGAYAAMLVQELANEQSPPQIRQVAGLALKNSMSAKSKGAQEEITRRWLQHTDPQIKHNIKAAVLQTLASPDKIASTAAGQVLAAIGEIELPLQAWPDLIQTLLHNITSQPDPNLRRATLQAIGFICEAIDPDVLSAQADQILTAVAQGARKEETNEEVRYAGIKSLYNCLGFIHDNFAREHERNYIMQIVCEAATCKESLRLQIAGFECLVMIMELYYDYMGFYMEKALFRLTVDGMKHESQDVVLQAVEFWSTICEEEFNLRMDEEEVRKGVAAPQNPPRENQQFAKKAGSELVDVLWWLMTKKEEDDEEDEWNIPMSAATCMSLLANVTEDQIVRPVISQVERHIRSEDWRYREAAVMAFGSIMQGPDPQLLSPLVGSALPTLVEMMKDPVFHVKDTTAWCLGRISEVLGPNIKPDQLQLLISALLQGLEDDTRVASNCAWCLINLSEHSIVDPEAKTYILSPYFDMIVISLTKASERAIRDPNFRTAAYEAISSFVNHAPADCLDTVGKLAVLLLERIEFSLQAQSQLIGADDKRVHFENQSDLCSTLTCCIRVLGGQVRPFADRAMQVMLLVIGTAPKGTMVYEDAFLTVGALAVAVEHDFVRYMEPFKPLLLGALSVHSDWSTCVVAVGVVGDICRALNEHLVPYSDDLMNVLMQDLQAPELSKDVKPSVMANFGDVALAIGGKFEVYLNPVMTVLAQASALATTDGLDPDRDYEQYEYVTNLREGLVEAYVGIVQAFKTGDKQTLIAPYLPGVFKFAESVAVDTYESDKTDNINRSLLGMIGDLAEALPIGQYRALFGGDWISSLNKRVRQDNRELARWAKEMVRRQLQGPTMAPH